MSLMSCVMVDGRPVGMKERQSVGCGGGPLLLPAIILMSLLHSLSCSVHLV